MNNHKDNSRPMVYFAAPLFSEAERTFNLHVTNMLEDYIDVYLPQRDGGLVSEMVSSGVPSKIAIRNVFNIDMQAIRRSDYLIAILDGRAIDEGVAFELGVAFSQEKCCVGLQTDSRRLASWGNNPMITGALENVYSEIDDLILWAKKKVVSSNINVTKNIFPKSESMCQD